MGRSSCCWGVRTWLKPAPTRKTRGGCTCTVTPALCEGKMVWECNVNGGFEWLISLSTIFFNILPHLPVDFHFSLLHPSSVPLSVVSPFAYPLIRPQVFGLGLLGMKLLSVFSTNLLCGHKFLLLLIYLGVKLGHVTSVCLSSLMSLNSFPLFIIHVFSSTGHTVPDIVIHTHSWYC